MKQSQKLERMAKCCKEAIDDYGEFFDLISTGGYDNDGSTGPQMVELGIGLGFDMCRYGEPVEMFVAYVEDGPHTCCYWSFGRDEDDAIARIREKLEVCDDEETRAALALFDGAS